MKTKNVVVLQISIFGETENQTVRETATILVEFPSVITVVERIDLGNLSASRIMVLWKLDVGFQFNLCNLY